MVLVPLNNRPARTPRQTETKPLLPGTRVQAKISGRVGTVQHYHPQWNRTGGFPVRFRDGLWEICGADDVTVLEAPNSR